MNPNKKICNPLKVGQGASSKNNLRPVLHCTVKSVPSV
jgi:hypothetical protein